MKPKTIQKYSNIIVRLDDNIILEQTDYQTYTIDQIKKFVKYTLDDSYHGKIVNVTYIRYVKKSNGVIRYRGDDSFQLEI